MQQETLRAEQRVTQGTRASKRLRREGRVPGVVYGVDIDPLAVHVSNRDLYTVLNTDAGRNAIIEVNVGDTRVLTVAREIQRDPVRGNITHLDFIQVKMDIEIDAEVAIEFIGIPRGVKDDGGVIETFDASVMISALPNAIPQSVEVSIEDLGVHDTLKVSDLPEVDGVTYIADPDHPLLTVVVPTVEEEPVEVLLDEEGMPIEIEAEDEGEIEAEDEG